MVWEFSSGNSGYLTRYSKTTGSQQQAVNVNLWMLNIGDDIESKNCILSDGKTKQIEYHKLTGREVFVEVDKSVGVRDVKGDGRAQSAPTVRNPWGEKKKRKKKTQFRKNIIKKMMYTQTLHGDEITSVWDNRLQSHGWASWWLPRCLESCLH